MLTEIETYADLLEALKQLTPEQLSQRLSILPPDVSGEVYLEPVLAIGTVAELCHVKDEICTQTHSHDDFEHHLEQIVIARDYHPFDRMGNFCYELTDDGFVGDKTGVVYTKNDFETLFIN